jgi:pantoate--beta-alanine ligase
VVDPDTLLDVSDLSRGALLAVAAWVGSTRLIDNLLLPPREV